MNLHSGNTLVQNCFEQFVYTGHDYIEEVLNQNFIQKEEKCVLDTPEFIYTIHITGQWTLFTNNNVQQNNLLCSGIGNSDLKTKCVTSKTIKKDKNAIRR